MSKLNYKNILLFTAFVVSSITALSFVWRLTFEPFFTNQLTTLTWFGVLVLVSSVIIAMTTWSEFWGENGKRKKH